MKKSKLLLLFAAMLLLFSACSKQNTAEADASADETAAVTASVLTVGEGDSEMDYVVFGSGEKTFVILPGLSVHSVMGSADAIAAAYQDFAADYTVYLFDRPKTLSEGLTIRDLADATAQAMTALGIRDADVFGASQGGMMAEYLAIDHPELVHKLILGSTLMQPNDTFDSVIDTWVSLAEARDEDGLLASFADTVYSAATLEAYRDTLIEGNRGITEEEYQRFVILASACKGFDCSEEITKITCPVLVLGSRGDQVVTARGSEEIAAALGCESYLYDETYGHGVYDEAADYKTRCLEFLKDE